MKNNYALITGASRGIGKAFATECASRKMNVLLVSLPNENLEGVSQMLSNDFGVKSDFLEIDLTENESPENVYKW